ncbi:MAG: response regulator [Spirochaetales bacterium]|nr:response regulator [Spirochaetales bacterium]
MKQKILIVDDMAENRKLLVSFIKNNTDYEVIISRGGIQVLKHLDEIIKNPPDLILLDILMPEVDGFEVARKLKEKAETKHIPVIFITALHDIQSKTEAFEAGGVDYISKPFNKYELLSRIRVHLDLQKVKTALRETAPSVPVDNLTSGIARELKEPINDINKFSKLNIETIRKLSDVFASYTGLFKEPDKQEIEKLLITLDENSKEVYTQGLKTDTIMKNFFKL